MITEDLSILKMKIMGKGTFSIVDRKKELNGKKGARQNEKCCRNEDLQGYCNFLKFMNIRTCVKSNEVARRLKFLEYTDRVLFLFRL